MAAGPKQKKLMRGQSTVAQVVDTLEPRLLFSANLVKDINLYTNSASDNSNQDITASGGKIYFLADDGIHGKQVWEFADTIASPLATPVMLTNLTSSTPSNLTDENGTLFFSENENGGELWKSDGTVAGTLMVQSTSTPFTSPSSLTSANSLLYFSAYGGTPSELSLYTSDGTNAGTKLVATLSDGDYYGINNVTPTSSDILFQYSSYTQPTTQVYYSTTATSTTKFLVDTNVNGSNIAISGITTPYVTFNGQGYFGASQGLIGGSNVITNSNIGTLVSYGGSLYYTGQDASGNQDLFKSDGTAVGIIKVAQLSPAPGAFAVDQPVVVNGVMLYAVDGPTGGQLWRSDGTAAGTYILQTVSYPVETNKNQIVVAGNEAYFIEDGDASYSDELWKTDGTGTPVVVEDIRPGTVGALANESTAAGVTTQNLVGTSTGRVYFSADDSVHGTEVWYAGGTAASTAMVADVNATTLSSSPTDLVNLNNQTIFLANDGNDGQSIWASDGTSAGTVLLAPATTLTNPSDLAVFGNRVYFSAYQPGVAGPTLWSTDGTLAGTGPTADTGFAPSNITAEGNALYYEAKATANGSYGFYKTDSSGANATQLISFDSSFPSGQIVAAGGKTFFESETLSNSAGATTLYSTDGTAAGTLAIDSFTSPYPNIAPQPISMIAFEGELYFAGSSPGNVSELWRTDGSVAGTQILKSLVSSGFGATYPTNFTVAGGLLYFLTFDGEGGNQLWRTDGTPTGTYEVAGKFVKFGGQSELVYFGGLTAFGNSLLFSLQDDVGNYPAISNGTVAGTVPLTNGSTTYLMSFASGFTIDGPKAYFNNGTTPLGTTLWSTDGTVAGTSAVTDFGSGPTFSSSINMIAMNSGEILFSASDVQHGIELWSYTPTSIAASGAISGAVTFTNSTQVPVTLYLDVNNDGTLDGTDITAVTDANGMYSFTDVPAGFYKLFQVIPAGYGQVTPTGGAAYWDSLSGGTSLTGQNFIDVKLPAATIAGTVSAGVINSGGLRLPGVTVYLDINNNGVLDNNEPSATTDADGNYLLTAPLTGNYTLRQVLPVNYNQSTPAASAGYTLAIAPGEQLGSSDFIDSPVSGLIAGFVTARDGTPLSGVTVYLDANGNLILDNGELSTTTDSSGSFAFLNVSTGSYTVRQIVPSGYTQIYPMPSDTAVSISSGTEATGQDFDDASLATGTITGEVQANGAGVPGAIIYLDANNNGKLDYPGEPFVQVDQAGEYAFYYVPIGSYTIRQVVPVGYAQTMPSTGNGFTVTVTAQSVFNQENFIDTSLAGSITVAGTVIDADSSTTPPISVYLDANNDGIFDGNELDCYTDSDGQYSFANVQPGSYTIRQQLDSNYVQTSPASNAGIPIVLTTGTHLTNENFTDAMFVPVNISGIVSVGAGGPPLAGVTVYLDANNDGLLNSNESSAVTNASGGFLFTSAIPGSYILRQIVPHGYFQLDPASGGRAINIGIGEFDSGIPFYDVPLLGTIGGTVFSTTNTRVDAADIYLDANNNSILDPGEIAINTDSSGNYYLTNIPAGSYTLRQIAPTGAIQVTPAGNAGIAVTVSDGSTQTQNFVDAFGNATVSGTVTSAGTIRVPGATVYVDVNQNSVFDNGEYNATTDANGNYTIAGVPFGSYTIRQVVPAGYVQLGPTSNSGLPITINSTTSITNVSFVDGPSNGSISGNVTANNASLSGETVYLDSNNNAVLDAGELSTVTNGSGAYTFSGVPLGAYVIRQVLPSAYTQVTPATNAGISINVSSGSSLSNENFVDALPAKALSQLTGILIGTAGSYLNGGNTIAKAMDENLNTYYDATAASGSWVGLDLGTPTIITYVAYASRSGYASRMNGGVFEGSNTADFSSGVVNLYVIASNANPSSSSLTKQIVTNTTAFRYVRYLSPANSNGNVAEVQFFGLTQGTVTPTPPVIPVVPPSGALTGTAIGTAGSYQNDGNTFAKALDGNLNTYFDGATGNGNWVGLDLGMPTMITAVAYASRNGYAGRMNGGIFQGSNTADFSSGVVTLYAIASNANPSSTTLTTQMISNSNAYRYVRYLSPNNSNGDVAEVEFFGTPSIAAPTLTKFTGSTIGTSGSYQNNGNTIAKAIDGSFSTFFDGPTANGNWVGLDLGAAQIVKQISFAPRSGYSSRMTGGIFQASNIADFSSGVVNLYTVTTAPAANVLTSVMINLTTAYRYYRYLSPNGSEGDIAEVAFYG